MTPPRVTADAAPTWRGAVDIDQLRLAVRELELTRDVAVHIGDITKVPGGERDGAAGTIDVSGPFHAVLLNDKMCAERLNHAVLHELRHGFQRDRLAELSDDPLAVAKLYTLGDELFGYKDNPFEEDAHDWATQNEGRFQIVRPA